MSRPSSGGAIASRSRASRSRKGLRPDQTIGSERRQLVGGETEEAAEDLVVVLADGRRREAAPTLDRREPEGQHRDGVGADNGMGGRLEQVAGNELRVLRKQAGIAQQSRGNAG